jgi:hypothetical protein
MPINREEIMKLTQGLGIAALAVSSLMAGRRYYQDWKFYNWINNSKKELDMRCDNCFTIDRLIDADCAGKNLTIGINGSVNPDNILSHQGIRLGQDGEIKKLVSFVKVDNALIYNFEGNTRLTISKDDKTNKIMYSFEMPEKTVVKEMDEKIWSMYKTIGLSSLELDRIAELK